MNHMSVIIITLIHNDSLRYYAQYFITAEFGVEKPAPRDNFHKIEYNNDNSDKNTNNNNDNNRNNNTSNIMNNVGTDKNDNHCYVIRTQV
jgi:hypothetical protein